MILVKHRIEEWSGYGLPPVYDVDGFLCWLYIYDRQDWAKDFFLQQLSSWAPWVCFSICFIRLKDILVWNCLCVTAPASADHPIWPKTQRSAPWSSFSCRFPLQPPPCLGLDPLVSYPKRWSLLFIFGFLYGSLSKQQRNIVQLCTMDPYMFVAPPFV